MPSTTPHAATAAPSHAHAHPHAHRRVPAKVGVSGLRASIGVRLALAVALSAVMWGAVVLVVHL